MKFPQIRFVLIPLLAGILSAAKAADTHELILITYSDVNLNVTTNTPVFPQSNHNELCHEGVWVLYERENYNGVEDGQRQILGSFHNPCYSAWSPFEGYRSARAIGVPNDFQVPSVTLMSEEFLRGKTFLLTEGEGSAAVLEFPVKSLVTINTNANVQFFSEPNFQGDSFCLRLRSCNEICWLWQWKLAYEIPWEGSLAKSARIGCTF